MRCPHGPLIAAEPQMLVRSPATFRDRPTFFAFWWFALGFFASLACSCPAPKGRSCAGLCICMVLCLSSCRASGACARVYSFLRSSKIICLLLAVFGSIARLACSCPAPKERSRACLCMCGVPSLAGLAGCREHRSAAGVVAAGVDPPPSCRLPLPACLLPCLME